MIVGTPLYAKVITGLLVLILLGVMRSPGRLVRFYFLVRPLVQPFAYNQYRLAGTLPLTGIFPVLIIGYTFLLTLFSRKRTFFVKNSVYLYIMLFFFLLSAIFSISYSSTIGWSLKFLTGVMMCVLMYNNTASEGDFMMLVKSLVYCSLVPMAFGYYQFVTGTGHAWKGQYYAGSRIDSFLGEYNAYGEFLSLIICAAIIWLSRETDKRKRLFVALSLLSLIISLILSLNRGSWIALAFGLSTAAIIFYRHIKIRWLVIAFTVISLAGGPIMIKRFQELDVKTGYGSKNTLEGRAHYWQDIFGLVLERPILGYGAGTAMAVLEKRFGEEAMALHNDYLLLWFECGIFTVMAYLLFLASNTLFFLTRRNTLFIVNYALSAACLYFMVISFFQNIIMNVTVFPMFMALVGAGLKLNVLADSSASASGGLTAPALPGAPC
jgi:O-antigen ligase